MTKHELRKFYNFSIQDFIKRFRAKNYTDVNEALKDSMKYLARYNLDPKYTKSDINELLFAIKNELLKLMAKHNFKANDKNLMVRSFIANPVQTTSYYLSKNDYIFDEIKDVPQGDKNYISFLRRNAYAINSNLKNPQYLNNYRRLEEIRSNALSIQVALESQLVDSDDPIKDELKKQKPNIIEKIFGRTSKEYKAFKNVFKNHFKNPDSPLYGDEKYLKDFAMRYLKHKFPDLEEGKLPTEAQINALGGKGKARASFCLKIVNAVNEKEALADRIKEINTEIKNSIDKFPWEKDEPQVKSLLEEQLENEEKNANAPIFEEHKKNLNEIEVEEYDSKYDQLDFHNEQDIFK